LYPMPIIPHLMELPRQHGSCSHQIQRAGNSLFMSK
jgi:hypothetical protein